MFSRSISSRSCQGISGCTALTIPPRGGITCSAPPAESISASAKLRQTYPIE